jgi:peptidylprolyl isomerase/peptidyl-prolyl cis-trans isomerase B (cyclophilin B)
MYDAPPPMEIDPDKYYYATFVTDRGNIKVQLFAKRAPNTVNNFVFLARQGFYDNTIFHRVLDGFMAQGGDPTGTGTGGPGYEFADEFYPGLNFDRPGLLAMANRGPNTNGSQFFITFAPTEWLNGQHTIFGEVIEGADVLDKLTRRDPIQQADIQGDTLYTVIIEESESSILPTPPGPAGSGRAGQLLQHSARDGYRSGPTLRRRDPHHQGGPDGGALPGQSAGGRQQLRGTGESGLLRPDPHHPGPAG